MRRVVGAPRFTACLAALLIAGDGLIAGNGHAQETIELPRADRPLAFELADVYRIGSAGAAADWEILNRIRGAGFAAAGNLHFLDAPNRVVTVGPGGNLLGQFGRVGEGPGEFAEAGQLDVLPGGRIVVSDLRRWAFHVFGADGAFERMARMALDISDREKFLRESYAWMRSEVYGARPAREGAAILSDGIRKIVRTDLSSDEARAETFVEAWVPPGTEAKFGSLAEVAGGGELGFVPPLVFDALPGGGIAFSDSSAYAVKVTGPGGGLLRILRRPIDPQPVTDRLKRAEIDRQLAQLSQARDPGGNVPPLARAMLSVVGSRAQAIEEMQFLDEVPVLYALRTTWEGNLWVQRRGQGPDLELGPIDVLTPYGRYLGTLGAGMRMPDEFGPDGLVAFVQNDEFNVPVIEVKRLPTGIR